MAQPGRSWASMVAGPGSQSKNHVSAEASHETATSHSQTAGGVKAESRAPSPRGQSARSSTQHPTPQHYTPKTNSSAESVYVLTLLTDAKHHQTMTKMREKYFPPRLNRLEAHVTLFHALPESQLEQTIKPVLAEVSKSTAPFPISAAKPFRLSKGIAIGVPKFKGGDDAREVHGRLKESWKDFLSRQDAGGLAAHYTIMNKVDDEAVVQKALSEVEGQWSGCKGTVEGLSLFRYDRGNWVHVQDFHFVGGT